MSLRHTTRLILAASLALSAAGCGLGSAPVNPVNAAGLAPTHGGSMITLPFGKGFAEVVVEPVKTPTKAASGVIHAYFLQPDGTGPLSPAPTEVSLDYGGTTVPLDASGDHFATKPGPFAPGREFSGEFVLKLNGETVTAAFTTR